jgi:riboflavin kinase, archaea type
LQLIVEGTVFSGKGEGKKFVALPWVKQQIVEKLGFEPFLGTLNLKLNVENQNKTAQLNNSKHVTVTPQKDFFAGKLIPAQINGVSCAIVIPQMPTYPKDTLEIVASTSLRKKLKLKDGDCVTVKLEI